MDNTITYGIREAKARLSEILRELEHGEGVIITRRGRPYGRLTAVGAGANDKPSLATLRGALSQLPDADYRDFQGIKGICGAGPIGPVRSSFRVRMPNGDAPQKGIQLRYRGNAAQVTISTGSRKMNDNLRPSVDEAEEPHISTAEELAAYLSENRRFATALVRELMNEVLTESWHPINEILENGYENSFYMEDLLGFDEEIEAIVITPMIEVVTDWDQPFDNHDFGMSVYAVLENIGVDDELASEFRPYLMGECWRLVETKGQSKPNSGFVDIFGLKVFEVYKPRQAELQQKLEQERQEDDEDDWDDGIAAEMHRDVLWVSIREAIPLIANWIAETIGAEGESLVFNALERMSSGQTEDAFDE